LNVESSKVVGVWRESIQLSYMNVVMNVQPTLPIVIATLLGRGKLQYGPQ